MKDFFNFKKMITPVIIKVLFWLGTLGCIIAGIFQIVMAYTGQLGFGVVLTGIGYIVLGPIVVRICCELLIILFSINDTLTDIQKQLNRQQYQEAQTHSENEG